uniref:RNA helicase n=1 Tax=Cyprinus carpio TaxID=7962 RepID=A0A8C2EEV2_CYPCA
MSFGNQGARVWRKTGEKEMPKCLKSSVKYPQSVMVWGAMSAAGVGPLCFIKGRVNAASYQEILEHFINKPLRFNGLSFLVFSLTAQPQQQTSQIQKQVKMQVGHFPSMQVIARVIVDLFYIQNKLTLCLFLVGPKVVYVPPPPPEEESSIFSHYASGINFDKYDDILVDVSGSNPPKAIMTFDEAGLCESLRKNVTKSGYVKPTPVQKHGIPIISAGRDLMACAQTGSGKTAAFLLPILQRLMADGVAASKFSEVQEPEAIIVAPTRELINQIYLEARKFAYGTCVRPVVVYGGINTGYTIREVLKGCNVLCGTPGRLLDIIGRGKVGLSKLRYLVLDEADRMLDMGFEPDMRKLVGSPGMPSKEDRQTLMFSATYPEDIQRMAADFLKVDYIFLAVGVVGGACSDVEQTIIQVDQYSKRDQLLELLRSTGNERTMVFVETKRSADFIATFLCQEKMSTTSIHGDREQREREKALSDFRTGQCPVLVATSVAARGLDIEQVQHVVNFDLPSSIDEYVHRIGRTGRCGNIGRAVSFFNPESDTPLARSLVKVLSGAQQEVPKWLEEIAFSAHGTTGFNPRGKVFASTDTRKGGSFKTDEPPQASAPSPAAAADDEEWE